MKGAPKPARVATLALPFQTDLDQLIGEPVPQVLRKWPVLGLGFLALLIGAAAVLPVDIVITAQGRLAADTPPILLRPMSRTILREILVRPGDVVQKGQVLAHLDTSLQQADRASLDAEARALMAEIARHQAELSGQTLHGSGRDFADQAVILDQRKQAHLANLAAVDAQIAALTQEQRLAADQLPNLVEKAEIAAQMAEMHIELAQRGSAATKDALVARSAALTAQSDLMALELQQSVLARQLHAARDQRTLLQAQFTREATEALPKLRLRLAQVQDALSKTAHMTQLSTLSAPRAGVVVSVAAGGAGAIIAEGEPLVAVVPTDAPLVAEVSISSADIGRLAVGDPVVLKIDAYPYRKYGQVGGVITSIGPISAVPEGGGAATHPARVALNADGTVLQGGATLIAGMTLTADVSIGTRTILDYFFDPIARGISESLREQ